MSNLTYVENVPISTHFHLLIWVT